MIRLSYIGVRSYSGQVIPRNIAEINDSHIGMASIDRLVRIQSIKCNASFLYLRYPYPPVYNIIQLAASPLASRGFAPRGN